mgnify:CR=1 FL=1|tara:strand:+ start:519334 stop:524988 length:5655 start_codon:yes stop_codon:yes gene_type:complete
MAKDKEPFGFNPSSGEGDDDDDAQSGGERSENPKNDETAEIEETTEILSGDDEQTMDGLDQTTTVGSDITLDNVSSDSVFDNASLETLQLDSARDIEKTVGDSSAATIAMDSALSDIDISQTINPRDLSGPDRSAWDEMTVGSVADKTIESSSQRASSGQESDSLRSFTETKLQIRDREVSAPKDDPNTPSDYRLVRMLGKGGMGNVYVAKQGSLDRMIAVKVIKPLEGKKRDQLQQSGRLEQVERDRRHQFLSEAVVTGDLDHPNIVPIHDIAVTSDNTLFYAMKRVVGTPWSKVIHDKTREENLDILLKVCDAIGFAHTRGVVHRDIKPENIMLGDFGVVMVMDWGLALAQPEFEKIESIAHTAGLGGTPAFMAPEMATGPLEKIGPAADIYLLGANLFCIVTGKPPHHAANISLCLKAVTSNEIREVQPQHRGELLDIALKAMATDPKDRYADVREFQQAIRQYRSHAESVLLTAGAEKDLRLARKNKEYSDFSRARFGFEQAVSLWDGNELAKLGLAETTISHATAAYENEDFDLGLSLLDADDTSHQPLIEQLLAGRKLRQQRVSRLRLFKAIAAAMLAFILVGGGIAVYMIDAKRRFAEQETERANQFGKLAMEQKSEAQKQAAIAETRRQEAERQTELAEEQTRIAKEEKQRADHEKQFAETQKALAETARDETALALKREEDANRKTKEALAQVTKAEAEAQSQKLEAIRSRDQERQQRRIADAATVRAEYETYLSQIGLAKARIESNEFDDARRILENVRALRESQHGGLAWEWRWLWRQANQSIASRRSPAALIDFVLSGSSKRSEHSSLSAGRPRGVAVLANGQLQPFTLASDGSIDLQPVMRLPGAAEASAVAVSPHGDQMAIATTRGDIQIWDRDITEHFLTLVGHESRVTRLQFVDEELLISGSTDKTARVWDTRRPDPLETCWHIAAVRDLAAVRKNENVLIAAAVSDANTGRAVLWSLRESGQNEMSAKQLGEFAEHDAPISSIALSPDGAAVVTGDVDGNVLMWQPGDSSMIDYSQAITSAVKGLSESTGIGDGSVDSRGDSRADSRGETRANSRKAPPSGAEASFVRLTDPDVAVGDARLAASGDDDVFVRQTLEDSADDGRAHADVVESVCFSRDGRSLLTTSDDYTLKLWDRSSLERRQPGLAKVLRGHGGWVTDATFIGDSRDAIVSASNDLTVRRWDAKNYVGEAIKTTNALAASDVAKDAPARSQAHGDEIWSARFDTSGTRVVSASRDHTARVLQIDPATMTFSEIATMQSERDDRLREGTAFMAMSFEVDREHGRLFVGSADAAVRIWDLEKGNEIGFASGTGLNSSFALSRDGTLLLTGSSSPDDKAILWRVDPASNRAPKVLWRIRKHVQAVTAFAISDDGKMFFTGDRNGLGYLWNVNDGTQIGKSVEDVRGYRINAACFSRDNRQLLLAADDQQVTRLDVNSRRRVGRLEHEGFVTRLSLSADGTQIVTVSEIATPDRIESSATLWDLTTETPHRLYRNAHKPDAKSNGTRVVDANFGDQDRWVVVAATSSGSQLARVMRFDTRDENLSDTKPKTLQLPSQLNSLQAAMPIGNRRLVTLNGDAAFLWDLDSMNHIKSYRDHGAVTQAVFSHDGRFVATASRSIKIWDAQTGQSLGKLESPHEGIVRSIDFSPKTMQLATVGDDGIAKLWKWNPTTSDFVAVTQFNLADISGSPDARLSCVRFSPDAEQLLVAGASGTARILAIKDNELLPFADLDIPEAGEFTSAAFSRDGQWIALGSDDKIARVQRIVADEPQKTKLIQLVGHADRIEDVAIVQDKSGEMRVLTASRDKSARVWDPRIDSDDRLGREVISLRRHTQGVTAVDATSDGRVAMTAGRDGAVMLWPAGPAESPKSNP